MSNPYSKPINLVRQAINRANAAKDAWRLCKDGSWSDDIAVQRSRELIEAAKLLEKELDTNWKEL